MISVFIIDSCISVMDELKTLLETYQKFNICGMFTNPYDVIIEMDKLLQLNSKRKPHGIFLYQSL